MFSCKHTHLELISYFDVVCELDFVGFRIITGADTGWFIDDWIRNLLVSLAVLIFIPAELEIRYLYCSFIETEMK